MKLRQSICLPGSVVWQLADEEIARWLGYPKGKAIEGRVLDVVDMAREWYARHGRPWIAFGCAQIETIRDDRVELEEGTILRSEALAQSCTEMNACTLALAASSAGRAIDRETTRLWAEERADEAFVLDRLGVAVIEYLRHDLRGRLVEGARFVGLDVAAGLGPGYVGWPLEDQEILLSRLAVMHGGLPGSLRALRSGMLVPKLSMLLAFPLGLPRSIDMDVTIPCSVCNYVKCAYRRMPSVGSFGESAGDFVRKAR